MDRPGNSSQRLPLTIWILFGAILLSFLVGGALFYRAQEEHLRADEEQKLLAIAQLKVDEIARWRLERQGDASVALAGPFFSAAVKRWLSAPDPALAAQITERLDAYRRGYRYASALIVDAAGHIRLSAGKEEEHVSPETAAYLEIALRERRPLLSELYRCSTHDVVHLDVIAPLLSDTATGKTAVAALILRIDPNEFLYPLIQLWPTKSTTAETILVRRDGDDVLFINELRHQKGTALNLRIPLSRLEVPAVRAVNGEEGIVEGLDYRGVPVLSVLKHIPDSSWYLVAKIDTAEAFAAWRFRATAIILGTLLLLGLTFAGIGFYWYRQRKEQYRTLYELEKRRHEGEENFRAIFEQSGVGVAQVAFDGRFLKVNPKFCDIVGYPAEELLRKIFLEISHPDDREADQIYVQNIVAGKKQAISREKRYIRKDGTVVWGNVTASLVRDAEGKPSFLLPVLEDISDRKRAEEALQLAREEWENTFDTITDMITVHDADFNIIRANKAARESLELSIDDNTCNALKCFRTYHGAEKPPVACPSCDCLRTGNPTRCETFEPFLNKHLEIRAIPRMKNGQLVGLVHVVRDISDRKRAEEALKASEDKLRAVLDATPFPVAVVNLQGDTIEFWSHSALVLFGHTAPTASEWYQIAYPDPDYRREVVERWTPFLETARRSGQTVNTGEYRVTCRDGSERICELHATFLSSNLIVTFDDITDRKALESAREELMNSLQDKNEEMESILYAASHDLRSPLVNIQGFSARIQGYLAELNRILKMKISAEERCETIAPIIRDNIPKALGFVTAGTDKMDALVNGLLKLSRLGRAAHTPEVIDMNGLMRETLDALKFQTQAAQALITVTDLPDCWGDRHEIGQTFSNLVDNAIKYRDSNRPLAIRITGTAMGDRVAYSVEDTGIGIKKGYQDQIWGLFSRLNPGGPVPGEGIGLTMVKRIIQRNRGRIWMESEPGKGSSFYIVLPHDRTAAGKTDTTAHT